MNADQEGLESRLSYSFRDRALLRRALTHKSRAFESSARGGEPSENNEQLEFLGDSVLGFVVSEVLVAHFPDLAEGLLSKAKARLVSADHLHEVATDLGLGSFLLLGRGEEMNGGRTKRALLADSLEAVIAAIYLDGGHEAVKRFIMDRIIGDPGEFDVQPTEVTDFKGALQELAQSQGLMPPRYRVVATAGPEHSKTFTVEVSVGEKLAAEAEGNSKKVAGQNAAAILFDKLTGRIAGQ